MQVETAQDGVDSRPRDAKRVPDAMRSRRPLASQRTDGRDLVEWCGTSALQRSARPVTESGDAFLSISSPPLLTVAREIPNSPIVACVNPSSRCLRIFSLPWVVSRALL